MKSLFSYVIPSDQGFAPNPYHGYCTLATCKPEIRRGAEVGDVVLGTGSTVKRLKRKGHLVYAMKVTETVSTSDYWLDPRFEVKKPNLSSKNAQIRCGDNIYEPLKEGGGNRLLRYTAEQPEAKTMSILDGTLSIPESL